MKFIIAGSFDPITNGHLWLINKTIQMMDNNSTLFIVIGNNTSKKYLFSFEERKQHISKILLEKIPLFFDRIKIDILEDEFLIDYASRNNVTHMVRGIRSFTDYEYEVTLQKINRKINSEIETLFLVPPLELTEVSSSIIKGLVGFKEWQDKIKDYIEPFLIQELTNKLIK